LHAGMQDSMRAFRDGVTKRYSEGTLQRLLQAGSETPRRAAALALGLAGTMRSNQRLAAALRDPDRLVRKFAADSLWEIWFRGTSPDLARQPRQPPALPDLAQRLAPPDARIPDF